MSLVEDTFKEYVAELHSHLFESQPFEKIVEKKRSHRARRFASMYLLKDKKTFLKYFEKKDELGLDELFNKIVAGLYSNTGNKKLKKIFIEKLDLIPTMATWDVKDFDIKEFDKDLNAFIFYQTKKELNS